MIPKAVLMRYGLVSLTTARPVNTAQPRSTMNSARPMTNGVNSVKDKNVNTARPKAVVNTAKPKAVLNAVKGNQVNAVKASACWVWKPKTKGNPQMDLQDQGVIDSGCSRHMTGNMSYLTDFEEIDGGYVAFGGNPKGGKITGRVPRKNNMYSVDLKNIVPKGGLTCLFAKATSDESELWHRRLRHINFKTMNKLVKGKLVRGLPSKLFENNQTCVACQKGKQHRASSTKDETSGILKSFITRVENLIDQRVKVIRCDNGTEFKNKEMDMFCERKCIKREFSVARTPQQNGVAERKNRTLIEAARTMLANSKLPTTFWTEAVNTGLHGCKNRFRCESLLCQSQFRLSDAKAKKQDSCAKEVRYLEHPLSSYEMGFLMSHCTNKLNVGDEFLLEAETFLFPLVGAEEMIVSFMTTSFNVSAFLVEEAFKIDLIVLGPVVGLVWGSTPGSFLMRFLALGWHLEEIHVTWAHLEKKRARLRLYTKNHEELCIQHVETASPS
ncbi:putative ribonuclease H-like domain-containing protein [Tanacetum coccineum]